MVFERYIPELKEYDGISFLHQPMTSGQPLKVVQRHMAHPVGYIDFGIFLIKQLFGRFNTASTGGQTWMNQLPFWPH